LITLLAQARDGAGRPLYRVRALPVDNPDYVLAYNDPAELLAVEAIIRSRRSRRMVAELPPGPAYRPVAGWIESFRGLLAGDPAANVLRAELVSLYGEEEPILAERARAFLEILELASRALEPAARVLLVRSPGRVNLLGRHVDHQGGHCNLMTIGYETLLAVHPRTDDRVRIVNLNSEHFPEREFSIGEMVADLPWDDWVSLVNSEKVSNEVLRAGGDWGQYVRAAALRLQKKFSDQPLRGADLVVGGNIPIAAGLSSSSALVVGTAEALVAVNRLDTFPSQLVNLCGEGEWYVGTRGGSADHAAIKYGRKGRVVKVTFFEFAVEEIVPFPDGYVLAVCDSGVKAHKTTGARDQFNHRVSCYRLGFRLVRRLFPQYTPLLHHLRDLNTRNLRVPLSWIYRILLHLPERATRGEIEAALSGEDLQNLFETHRPPEDGIYPLRGVVLYGLAECERSRLFADALREGRVVEIGRLMSVSHDGDRVARFTAQGEPVPYNVPVSNSFLLNLIEDLESGDPQRVLRAQLQWQPGAYRCSIPEIDCMVDIAMGAEGTIGAQLAGAGLGGCMMVLTRRESFPLLRRALIERYYGPAGMPPAILECRPISGSSVLLLPPSPADSGDAETGGFR
jgi:N-acetylgalactosamine kinase